MAELKWALRTAAGWSSMSVPEQAVYEGYYENISDWITNQVDGYDFVTNTATKVLECYNDWAGGKAEQINPSFTVAPTCDTTYRPVIKAAPGHECGGTLGQGFGIKASVSYGSLLNLLPFPHITLDGFWFENTGANSANGLYGKCNLRAYRLVGKSASAHVFYNIGTGDVVDSCLAVGGDRGYSNYNWENGVVKNSGASGCTTGFYSNTNGSFTAENCWSYGNTTSYGGTAYSGSSTNNAASDAATVTPPGSNPILTNIVSGDFVDAANDDYHITSGSTLRGAGTNRYTDGSATDIDGDAWPNAAWDVGPDYYVSSGITLTIADAAHGHTADGLTLTLDGVLVLADALHSHAADNLGLTQANVITIAEATHAHSADNIALSAVGVITLPAMKNNTGTVNASDTGITVDVYSIATGALVERFTGETTDASGICSVASSNLSPGTSYVVVVRRSTDAIGLAEVAAS